MNDDQTIDQLLAHLGQQAPSIPIQKAQTWIQRGRKKPRFHWSVWLSRVYRWRWN